MLLSHSLRPHKHRRCFEHYCARMSPATQLRASRGLGSGSWIDMNSAHHPEDGKRRGNLFKFRTWCILVHGDKGPRSWYPLHVRLQDGSVPLGSNLFQMDLLTPAAVEHRSSPGSPHVLNPIDALSKH